MTLRRATGLVLLALTAPVALGAVAWAAMRLAGDPFPHYADADNAALAVKGAHIYRRECGGCHGGHLQGQPFWRLADADRGRRAPALDAAGPAWRRSDADLFGIVKYARFPERRGTASHMPAYAGELPDKDILAALAFLKSRWPLGVRALQARLNPGERGMPREALTTDWRLPADCLSANAAAVVQSR